MSEYQHPSQITRFLGSGTHPSKFIQQVRERPFSVLLLDEAEKATPEIYDAFLTVLDEGLLVDGFGRVTDFRNCIIILTTNLGAGGRPSVGFKTSTPSDDVYRAAIGAYFRPEFVNRIDHMVVFQPLEMNSILQIAERELLAVGKREGFAKRSLQLEFTENLISQVASAGFHPKYGARPLQRTIEDMVVNGLAAWLLRQPRLSDKKLVVDFQEGALVVSSEQVKAA